MKRIDVRGLGCFGGNSSHVGMAIRLWLSFLFALLLLGLLTRSANAQDHIWSQLVGGAGNSTGLAVATDEDANVIVGGEFDGAMSVGGDTVTTSPFSRDVYVAKFSGSGDPVWIIQIGGAGDDTLAAIAVDQAGNVAVTGGTSSGAVFLALLDGADGSIAWSRSFSGDGPTISAGVAVDEDGNVILAAGFRGSADFGGGSLSSAGSYDLLLASYDSANGAHRWSRRFGGTGDELAEGVAAGPGDVIAVAGNFSATTDLGSGPLPFNGLSDIFVATYSTANGAAIWSKALGGTGFDVAHAVGLDAQGNALVTGYFGLFGGPVDFGAGSITSNGGADLFLVKYDAAGSHQWSRTFGGIGDDYAYGVAVDSAGNCTVTGSFQLTVDFGGGAQTSAGQIDSFVAHYTATGQHDWSHTYGSLVTDKGLAVATDPSKQILATGFTLWNVNFGGGILINSGNSDAYLVKLGSDEPATPSPTPTPTPTATATRTATPSPSQTPTSISTSTATSTPTRTRTLTPTATPTPTRTPTSISTSTATPTPTRTRTLTPTATPTPTRTPTSVSTSTATPTAISTSTPTREATLLGDCPASPDPDCMTGFEKGTLVVGGLPGEGRLLAKMLKGPALEQTDVGNPLDSSRGGSGTSFSLCVYGEDRSVAGELTVDRAGEICADGRDCWQPIGKAPTDPDGPGKGYSYTDKALAADGVLKIMYRGGSAGRSKVLLKAKGPNLPGSIAERIQGSSEATVQLRSSDGVCLSVTLSGNDRLFNRVN
jgi:hypothetical protein